jgi:hypothetical protein
MPITLTEQFRFSLLRTPPLDVKLLPGRLTDIGGSTQGNSKPFDWVDLVAGIRAGDQEAVLQLGNIFQDGIRFFLRRGLGQQKLQSRQREVFSLVIESIIETRIDNPNRLASHVLTVLHQYINSQTTAGTPLVLENEAHVNINTVRVIRELLAKIAAVDREALRRYYVDNETSDQICQALNITTTQFHAVKCTLRTAATRRA